MPGGKAHGANREYQVQCRDVLTFGNSDLAPWAADGIDVPFDLPDTCWTVDVALRRSDGSLVVVECRRTAEAVKQGDVASLAYKVEMLRKSLGIPVAGFFIAKTGHQLGAIRVGEYNGIEIVVLEEGSTPPAFNMTFLRYDKERETQIQHIITHLPPGELNITGHPVTLIYRKLSGETETR